MSQTVAITTAITTLAEAESRFGLQRNEDVLFFSEWRQNLPQLTTTDLTQLDELRRRYIYHRSSGHLLENTVTLLLASPLLALAGFYDPPFRVRAEEAIRLEVSDSEETLQGRIDALVVCDTLWVILLESKKTMLSIWSALPQALAYMQGNPQHDRPCFGILTNGDEIIFVKAISGVSSQYNLSRVFSPFVAGSELTESLQVLRHIGTIVTTSPTN